MPFGEVDMSDQDKKSGSARSEPELESSAGLNIKVIGSAATFIIVAVVGIYFAFNFVEEERSRNLQAWQIRMGIVADSRTAAASEWIEDNFSSIRELSENASLQLYMTELAFAEEGEIDEEDAESGYLRNLLVATAERTGFKNPDPVGEVNSNVERLGLAGLALVDVGGRPLVATPGMPPITPSIRQAIATALTGIPVLIDMYESAGGQPAIGFALPVYAIQGDETEGIGAVVGLRVVDKTLYETLIQPGDTEKTSETYLVRKKGGLVEYLSPLSDDSEPLKRSLAFDTPDLAAAYALQNPGGFGIRRDYTGNQVLVTSRPVPNTPWVLVRKVTEKEALSETDTRLTTILVVFILVIVGVVIAVVAVWRHGTSVRAAAAAEKYRISAERFENLIQFNRVMMDNQPTHVVCVNPKNQVTFSNRPFADAWGIHIMDIKNKPLSSVIGPDRAKLYTEINNRVVETGERESHVKIFDGPEGKSVINSFHIRIDGDRDHPAAALMVLHDLTEVTKEREKREEGMKQLIGTLVSVVDRRDPYSANHSSRVSEVARAIGQEMDMDDVELETVDIAGSLMNLGKIFIPPELLTKAGKLTDEERDLLGNSFIVSSELLEGVEFEGPVRETVSQIGESWDGSGPLGIKENDILRTARAVSVANVFVGMLSPRAYRDAMTFDKVAAILMEQAESKFDKKAVVALVNVLENRNGRERWAHYRETPKDT